MFVCLNLFLACQELYHGYKAKFLIIIYWIAATYVLAGVYSAQLTSEFARPARESPINTLQRLQMAMIDDGYQLFVEKESSSLDMLEVRIYIMVYNGYITSKCSIPPILGLTYIIL